MQSIWVTGNPFTRTHAPTYRTSIFNFFRETPGFTEDIQLDGSLPGIVERRHLIDRVFEKPPLSPSITRLTSPPPLGHPHMSPRRGGSPSPPVREVQTMGRSARKKKPARQRIVSLDEARMSPEPHAEQQTPAQTDKAADSSDEYRKRLEALREEAGNGWLKVLSESGGLAENGVRENSAKV
jgi:hypothetical protein